MDKEEKKDDENEEKKDTYYNPFSQNLLGNNHKIFLLSCSPKFSSVKLSADILDIIFFFKYILEFVFFI